jgi:GH15 family glucan-1,4-alpha-glucosidase
MSTLPIGDYALLSDCRSAALVGRDGSVDWLCFRRFDGPSVFARLLDDDAGHLSVRPAGEFAATRRYLDQTMALATTFTTATGVAVLTDALAHASSWEAQPAAWAQDEIAARLDDTIEGWRSWSAIHQAYEGPGGSWCITPGGCCRR